MESETLEFPPIAAPAEPRTEIATAAAGALDLEKLNLTDLALAKFGDWRANVAAVTANLTTLALDLSTQARVDEAKSLRERLINKPRAEARKVSKALRSKFAATGKEVAAAEEQVVQAWDQAETLITPKIDAAQKTLDDEKARRVAEEEARKEKHRSGIANIRCYLDRCHAPGMTSERIARGMEALQAMTFGPEWEDFQVPAANAQCETLEAMRQLHAQVLGREQEAARQEQIRQENERQAELNRIEAKRIADEAAEIRRQAAELAAAQEAQRREQVMLHGDPAAPVPPAEAVVANGRTPVTAAGFASLGERWTDEDPGAATKLPGEAAESMGAQEGVGLMEVAPRRVITIELDQTPPAPIPPAPEPATIKLGELSDWAGFTMTRAFVQDRMGIVPTIEGSKVLFTATQKRELKAALLKHVEGLQA